MRSTRPNAESSLAGCALTPIGAGASAARIAVAIAVPATAAVPWPITMMRRIVPAARRSCRSEGIVSGPSRTTSRPSTLPIRPRSVLRSVLGDSEISLSRKCWWRPRWMSRVVISVLSSSAGSTGSKSPP